MFYLCRVKTFFEIPPRLHRARDAPRIWADKHERQTVRPRFRAHALARQLRANAGQHPKLQPLLLRAQ